MRLRPGSMLLFPLARVFALTRTGESDAPLTLDVPGPAGHPPPGVVVAWAALIASGLLLAIALVIGARHARRHVRRAALPIIDLNQRKTRRALISGLTVLVACTAIAGVSTVKVVEYTESNAFCGETCHTVMAPEYTAFQRSAHSGIHCVDCHVGPGVGGFVRAKINGSVQLAEVILGNYGAPISTPVHNLPDPEGTCMTCHSTDADHGVKPRVITRFAEDRHNTERKTVLLLDVGGRRHDGFEGIHRHVDPDVAIRYRADPERRTISEVEVTRADGTMTRYASSRATDTADFEWHSMNCIDCHNRPSHNYAEAAEAVDLMLERGLIPRDLPFIKREGLRAISAEYDSHDAARAGIADDVAAFYRAHAPGLAVDRADDIDAAASALGAAYAANVFPGMNIGWGTYPDHLGHETSGGCFRCHGGDHTSTSGETISADCRLCHTILAWDEASPEVLQLIEARERGGVSPSLPDAPP